jgi:hypothetical protein
MRGLAELWTLFKANWQYRKDEQHERTEHFLTRLERLVALVERN